MSNPACFLYDICGFKVKDMECMDIAKSEEGLEPQDENQKVEKLKESHLLLKKKLSLSHELIRQYNDKIKECQQVSAELETVKDNLKKATTKFNSGVVKIAQLELEIEDYKQKIAHYSKIVPEQQTKIAADQQHLQQLICKVQQLERKEINAAKLKKDDPLKEKVKTLEAELKASKDSHKSEITQMEIKLKSIKAANVVKNQTKKKEAKISHEKATCTGNELEPVIARPETAEKCVMTREFYSVKDDPYPLFCAKCITKLDPAPLDQIFKHMSACPPMVTGIQSPTKESDNTRRHKNHRASIREDEITVGNTNSDSAEKNSDVSQSDFKRLERKICLLERKLHKKVKNGVERDRNPCCNFQFPNNCYLGPYQNLFQPGPMIRTQSDLFRFQNWQGDSRSKKRNRRSSIQKPKSMKSRKKRKLDDGTSEWNVDSVPGRELIDFDRASSPENCTQPLNLPLRAESPPLRLHSSEKRPSKRPKESKSSHPSTRKKKEKLGTLFSPLRSPSPKLPSDAEEDVYSKTRSEEPRVESCVQNQTFSDEEMAPDAPPTSEQTVEYQPVECVKKKRGRPPKNAPKAPAKRSLVKKIRNLKKNCNKIKPLVAKTVSVNNNTNNTATNQISAATIPVNELRESVDCEEPLECSVGRSDPIGNRQSLNGADDYCPVKKHRIAHNARKQENDALCEADKNPVEIEKASSEVDSVKDNAQSETVAIIEKLDICKGKIETIECIKNPKSVFQIERRSSLRDSDAVCSQLVKKPVVKYFEVECVAETAGSETEKTTNSNPNASASSVEKTPDVKEKSVSLQPCVMIPRMYLDIEGVVDPCTADIETAEDKSNSGSNIDKNSSQDSTPRILRSKRKISRADDKVSSVNDTLSTSEDVIDESSTGNMKMELNVQPPEFSDNETSDVHMTSMSVKSDRSEDVNNEASENDKAAPAVAARKYKRRTRVIASPASPMRELRSRRIILSPTSNPEENISIKAEGKKRSIETLSSVTESSENLINQCGEGFGPKVLFKQLLSKRSTSRNQDSYSKKRFNEKLQTRRENMVIKELTKLAEDSEWTKAALSEGIERLSKFKTHTIAKCTIDFLVTRVEDDEELDKSHTPPAPLLSKTQQRILTMLVVLNRTIPDIIKLVQAGIEYRLFRLGYAPEVNVIEELARVFTALARIQKDRERVRILCCDAIYCLGLKAMPLIYVILISWPEVFPMAGASTDPLSLCLINSIMTQTGDTMFPKFFPLKKLLTGYYNYESSGYTTDAFAKNLMTTLKEKRQNGIDTAIILLAKKKGPNWTQRNIIQGGLLQMIIQKSHPSIYDAFCLLGHLMRSYPLNDTEGSVHNIIEQLCALMESGEGSMEQQAGVATALLSLHRHKPQVVTRTIMNWKPSEPLSESMSRQLTALFNNHTPCFWTKLLNTNTKKLTQAKK